MVNGARMIAQAQGWVGQGNVSGLRTPLQEKPNPRRPGTSIIHIQVGNKHPPAPFVFQKKKRKKERDHFCGFGTEDKTKHMSDHPVYILEHVIFNLGSLGPS